MRYLFTHRGAWYLGFAFALVSFGLVGMAFAHMSGDLCALENLGYKQRAERHDQRGDDMR